MYDGALDLLETRLMRRADVTLHVMDTGGVLFDAPAQRLYGTNTTATFIWCLLEDDIAPREIALRVHQTFGVDLPDAENLVSESFRQWRDLGLIGFGVEPSPPPSLVTSGAARRVRPRTAPPPLIRGARYQRDYRLLDTRIRLRFSSRTLLAYVEPLLAPLADDDLDEFRDLLYLIQMPDRILLCNQERVIDECEGWSGIMPMLKASLVLYALDRSDDFAAVHAAALTRGKKCLLIPGESGQGKSTLSAALVAAGFRLLGDDTIVLSRQALQARAMPFGICLKKGSWPLLASRFPALADGPIHDRVDGKRIRYLLPANHGSWTSSGFQAPIGTVVFLDRREAVEPALSSLDPGAAFPRFLREFYPLRGGLDAQKVERLVRWAAGLQFVELRYSSLDDGVAQLMELGS